MNQLINQSFNQPNPVCQDYNAFNRPFPKSENCHFQNEAECKNVLVKMIFI